MFRRFVALAIALLLPAIVWAQSPVLPGFPPGAFQSRAAIDAGSAAPSTVQVDQVASAAVLSASGTSLTFNNQTVTAALSGGALVVIITQSTTADITGMTLTWDSGGSNQSMTQVCNLDVGNGQVWIFGLLAPTSGNKTLSLSWTTTGQVLIDALSLKNVNQTNTATAFAHAISGTVGFGSPSLTVTSQANDLIINSWSSIGAFNGTFSGTEIYHSNSGVTWGGAGSYDPGAVSVNTTATTVSNAWIGCAIDVVHN